MALNLRKSGAILTGTLLVLVLTGADPIPDDTPPSEPEMTATNPAPSAIEERAEQRQRREQRWRQMRQCGREQAAVQLGRRPGLSGGCMIQRRQQFRHPP